MLSVLAPPILLLQYYLTAIYLKQRQYKSLVVVLLFAMITYDWVFIQATYLLPGPVVGLLKPYFEYLLLCLMVGRLRADPGFTVFNLQVRQVLVLLGIPLVLVTIGSDIKSPRPLMDYFYGVRLFLLPVLLLLLLFRQGVFRKITPGFILNCIVVTSVGFFVTGVIQRVSFTGDVRDLWFFEFFNRTYPNPVLAGRANYIRNDALRVTGIFVSPITQTISLGIGVIVLAAKLIFQKTTFSKKTLWIFLLLMLLYGQWRTLTRVGLIMDVLGIAMLLGSRFWARRQGGLFLIPVGAVAATFASLLSGSIQEASAVGRLAQFADLRNLFQLQGLGFSHPLVSTYFDSYFITLALLFGIWVAFPVFFLWKINQAAVQLLRRFPGSVLPNATLAISGAFVYLFTFQFVAGSWPYRLYFLLLFYCWFAYDQYLKSQVCPADADGLVPTDTL